MLAAAVALTAGWIVLRAAWWTETGLVRTVFSHIGFTGAATRDIAPGIDLGFMNVAHGPRRQFSARWEGVWLVDRSGAYDLHLAADDWAQLALDGERVLVRAAGEPAASVTRTLTEGPHTIAVDYEQEGGHAFLTLTWSPAGEPRRPFDATHLFPSVPAGTAPWRNTIVSKLGLAAAAAWTLAALVAAWRLLAPVVRRLPRGAGPIAAGTVRFATGHARVLAPAAATLIVLLAAALRFEAICTQYGPFTSPPWLFELEVHTRDRIGAIRPDIFAWRKVEHPYVGGDPINYIRFAREMQSFYAAHVREPMFPFVTKLWLPLVDGRDVAVSFASASFSVLAVWATYLVGAAAYSRSVGLIAALGLAIDKDMATWGADGWRDDALTAFVALWAWALVRAARTASWSWPVWLGLIGAGAVLTRITALSFVLPSLALAALWPTAIPLRVRLRGMLVATVLMAGLVAPYLVNCWRTYGDPLYAINYHTTFYRARSGQPYDRPMGTASYLAGQWRRDPFGTIRLASEGVTTYPFEVKWTGFDFWYPGLGRILKWAAAAGLILMATSAIGVLLLTVLVTSLVPYAFTWNIPGGGEWRFTMHAYPFYLVALGLVLTQLTAWAWRRFGPRSPTELH